MNTQKVQIGVSAPRSGASASMGTEMVQAIELAVDDANSAGNVKVEARVTDDEGQPERAYSVARQFCSTPELLGVVGHYNSDVSIAASDVYAECGLVMITPIASNPELTERGLPNVFRFTNRDDRTAAAIAGYLYTVRGKRKAVVVESRSAYGVSMARNFADAFRRQGGTITAQHSVDVGEREFRSLVRKLPSGFGLLFYGGTFEGAPLLQALRHAGFAQLFATGDGCWDTRNFLDPAGEAATQGEGVLVLAATPEAGWVKGSAEFAQRYERRYGPITNYAVNSYDAASALIAAIRNATQAAGGLPAREEVRGAMRTLRYAGIAYPEPTAWDAKGDNYAALTALYDVAGGAFHQLAVTAASLHAGSTRSPKP